MIRHQCLTGNIFILEPDDFFPVVRPIVIDAVSLLSHPKQLLGIVSPSALTSDDTRQIFGQSQNAGAVTRAWNLKGSVSIGRNGKLICFFESNPPRTYMPASHDDVVIGDVIPDEEMRFTNLLNKHESHFLWSMNK